MVPSGFRRIAHLCFINQFSENDISWPQQPLTKKVQKFNMIFHYSTPNFFFHNIRIKLNSNAWMTLKSLAVVVQALKLLRPQ